MSRVGERVIVDVWVDDSSIGHTEPMRGIVISQREITRKKWRKPEQGIKQYAVEVESQRRGTVRGKIVWRDDEDIYPLKAKR